MKPKNFNTPAHTLVNALDQWHSALTKHSNNLFAQPLHRQQVGFDPVHCFALLPQLQPPAGRVQGVTPTIDLSDPLMACVSLTRFSQWGGFCRQTWAMNRQGPHALMLKCETEQVNCDCGVVF
jgi:hypothetical protein